MGEKAAAALRTVRERLQLWLTPKRAVLLAAATYYFRQRWGEEAPAPAALREVAVSALHSEYAARQAWRFGLGSLILLLVFLLLRALNERQASA